MFHVDSGLKHSLICSLTLWPFYSTLKIRSGFYCIHSQLQNPSPDAFVHLGSLVSATHPHTLIKEASKGGKLTLKSLTCLLDSCYTKPEGTWLIPDSLMVKRELLVLHFPLQWAREYVRHTVGIEMLLLPYRAQVWGGRSLCVTTHTGKGVMRWWGKGAWILPCLKFPAGPWWGPWSCLAVVSVELGPLDFTCFLSLISAHWFSPSWLTILWLSVLEHPHVLHLALGRLHTR